MMLEQQLPTSRTDKFCMLSLLGYFQAKLPSGLQLHGIATPHFVIHALVLFLKIKVFFDHPVQGKEAGQCLFTVMQWHNMLLS